MSNLSNQNEIPIVCVLDAMTIQEQSQHEEVRQRMFSNMVEHHELDKGYEFVFPVVELVTVSQFVANERKCCPFFDFAIIVEPSAEVVKLRLSGSADVKAFIQNNISELIDPNFKL